MVNVEGQAIRLLRAAGIDARASVPETRPASFVTVERTGGAIEPDTGIDRALVTVDAWGPTKAVAFGLMSSALAALAAMPGTGGVTHVEVNSAYYSPDAPTGTPAYRALIQIVAH